MLRFWFLLNLKIFYKKRLQKENVNEMDWFDKIKINDDITITMLPAHIGANAGYGALVIQIEVFGEVF